MKEFAKDYSTIIPPIAIDDLRDERIVDMSFELANAKADQDLHKESMRRRTTSDASPMFASWRGVDEVENTVDRTGSTETECSGSTTPSTTPSPPTPKKILRRATLSIGGGGSTTHNPMKFGRRNSMPNAFKPDNKEKIKFKRVSWPGVEDDENEDENDQCPLPTHNHNPLNCSEELVVQLLQYKYKRHHRIGRLVFVWKKNSSRRTR